MRSHIARLPVDNGGRRAGTHAGTAATSDFAARLRRLFGCDRGVAAVEFGLAAPILLAILVPVADLGLAYSQDQQLRQAVQAGAQYAAIHPWNQNASTAIAAAVTAATPLSGVTTSPAPYQLCGCPNGSGVTTATCGTYCTNGQTPGYYVVIAAQLTYRPVLPYSVLGSSTILTAQSTIRIR